MATQLAFALRHWYWWDENKYKTEIVLVDVNGQNLRPLVQTDWGVDATHPSWSDRWCTDLLYSFLPALRAMISAARARQYPAMLLLEIRRPSLSPTTTPAICPPLDRCDRLERSCYNQTILFRKEH